MMAEWLVTGVSWGVTAACAAITFMVVMGFAIGVLSFIRWMLKGGHGDEVTNTENTCDKGDEGDDNSV